MKSIKTISAYVFLSVATFLAFASPALADISPQRHNVVLKKIELASGKRYQRRSAPVSPAHYRHRKKQLKNLRRSCKRNSQHVRGTHYGGSGDSTSGIIGYRGDNLTETDNTFAELSTNPFGKLDFAALGGLPHRAERWIHNGRRSELGVKRDVGAGGSRYPKIDLWHTLANKLRFRDGYLHVTVKPCRGVFK